MILPTKYSDSTLLLPYCPKEAFGSLANNFYICATMKPQPLISIITVCRNAAESITPTLDSIAMQSFRDFEFIVIDGKSTDATVSLINNHPAAVDRLVSEPDRGIYDAMNKGRNLANGKYLMFLNAGDSLHSADTLKIIAAAAIDNSFPDIIYGDTVIVAQDRTPLASRHLSIPRELSFKSFSNGMVVCHQAFIAKKDITPEFNTDYRLSADYDWCIRCLQQSSHNQLIPSVLIDYLYAGASTKHRRKSLMERFRIMCHYYGTIPTIWRHLGFIPRRLRRRRLEKSFPDS